jgi:hypothetical protein
MKKIIFCSFIFCAMTSTFAYDGLGNQFTNKTNNNFKSFEQVKQSTNGFTIQSINENDIIINQYVDNNNNIFAITWSGVVTPDFSTLLGSYSNYQDNNNLKDLKNRIINDNDLVIIKHYSGRLKKGAAYLKSMLPNGFDINKLYQ